MSRENGAGAPAVGTTAERLARELRDVEAAIELIRTGAASRVTLSGLHFAEAVLAGLGAQVRREGIALDPVYWPEDAGCDVTVRRIDVDA